MVVYLSREVIQMTNNIILVETTANTLSAALALLAVHPETQDWLYNSIKQTIGDREPVRHSFLCLRFG